MASWAIKSPFIKCVSHSDWKLTIEFKNGSRFRYFGVAAADYLKMIVSANPGTYYIQNIKKKYPAKKLNPNQQ